jgi:hypothetical protein
LFPAPAKSATAARTTEPPTAAGSAETASAETTAAARTAKCAVAAGSAKEAAKSAGICVSVQDHPSGRHLLNLRPEHLPLFVGRLELLLDIRHGVAEPAEILPVLITVVSAVSALAPVSFAPLAFRTVIGKGRRAIVRPIIALGRIAPLGRTVGWRLGCDDSGKSGRGKDHRQTAEEHSTISENEK